MLSISSQQYHQNSLQLKSFKPTPAFKFGFKYEDRFVAHDLQAVPEFFVTKWLKLAQAEAPAYQAKGYDLIKLSIGGPQEPPNAVYLKALAKAAQKPGAHQYSPAKPELKQAFKSMLQQQAAIQTNTPNSQIVVLNAINTGLAYTIQHVLNDQPTAAPLTAVDKIKRWWNQSLLQKQPAIVSPTPEYPTFDSSIQLSNFKKLPAELKLENDFHPDLEAIIRANPRQDVRAAIINFPNNPTGAVATPDYLRQLLVAAKNHHVVLISDMAYGYYQPDQLGTPSLYAMAQKMDAEEGLIGTQQEKYTDFVLEFWSLSKLGYAGDRIGVAIGPDYLINPLEKYYTLMSGSTSLPQYVQEATVELLSNPEFRDAGTTMRELYKSRYDYTVEQLKTLNWDVNEQGGPFYYWGKFPKQSGCRTSSDFAEKLLKDTGVLVIPGSDFGKQWDDYIRIAMTQPQKALEEAFKRMKQEGYAY